MAMSLAARFDQQAGDMDDSSNEFYLVDKKSNKFDIWKYFALRVNEDDKVVDYLFIYLFMFIFLQ